MSNRSPADRTASRTVTIWDLPLRLWHWALAACVLAAWFTPTVYDGLHRIVGYAVLGLLAFRLVWGFWGSRYSRFRMVGVRLRAAPRYLWNLRRGVTGRYIGLNPAGTLMLVALLASLAVSTISGAMSVTVTLLRRLVGRGHPSLFIGRGHRPGRAARLGRAADGLSSAREPDPRDDHRTQAHSRSPLNVRCGSRHRLFAV
ncbi:cytochrome b [Bradyrhizobium sp. LM6.10]